MQAPGSLIIISAPSGTGKTSLVSALMQNLTNIRISISHTTRPARPGEVSGEHYYFVTPQEFNTMLKADVFLEHAEVFGNFYGTSKDWVEKTLQQGDDVILEIDWQGAKQIRQKIPDTVSIFILPPSEIILRQRLQARAQDSAKVIEGRMQQAKHEVSHFSEYDYLIVNDDFDAALNHLITIILAARLRCKKQKLLQQRLIDQFRSST